MSVKVTTGDDINLSVQLRKDNTAFAIDTGATVRAALRRNTTLITSAITCSSATPGADWANSLVVVQIPSATSATLSVGGADLEIEVDDGGKLTWIITGIAIERGLIA